MRKLIIIFILACATSCDIQKEASKTKTDSEINEQYERIEKRDGGTATFNPTPNIIYRDTTIVVQGTNGTELKVIYDKQGNASQIDCNGALIDIVEKLTRERTESIKEKESSKTEEMNTDWILYAFIAFALIVCFGLFMLYLLIQKRLPGGGQPS